MLAIIYWGSVECQEVITWCQRPINLSFSLPIHPCLVQPHRNKNSCWASEKCRIGFKTEAGTSFAQLSNGWWGQTEFVRTRRLARLSSIWLRLSSEEMRMDRLVEEQEQHLWGPGGYPGCPLIRCEAVLSRCEVVLRGYENEVKQIKTKNNYTWFIFKKKLKARFKNRARYSKTMIMSIKEKPRRSPE